MNGEHAGWHVAPFDGKTQDRTAFSCGAPELDRYLHSYASQDIDRDVARVFVAIAPNSERIIGYYSLSAASFQKDGLPARQAKKLPHYPVPAVLLGRLAVNNAEKGRGLGAHLLMDAISRVFLASQTLAVHAVVVDARDDAAMQFYRKYGFIPLVDSHRRLFLTLATIRRLVGEAP